MFSCLRKRKKGLSYMLCGLFFLEKFSLKIKVFERKPSPAQLGRAGPGFPRLSGLPAPFGQLSLPSGVLPGPARAETC